MGEDYTIDHDMQQTVNAAMAIPRPSIARNKVLYIAGPMRKRSYFNFWAFDEAKRRLLDAGYSVISPADIDRLRGFEPADCKEFADPKMCVETHDACPFKLEDCLKYDLFALELCHGIALLDDWRESEGAKIELRHASSLGLESHLVGVWCQMEREGEEKKCPEWGKLMQQVDVAIGKMRTFDTGATRDNDETKLDYEGFLSPLVLESYGKYMHKHRTLRDGSVRGSDNWQKGFGEHHYDVCMKSLIRHIVDVWKEHRGIPTPDGMESAINAAMFNLQAYQHQRLLKGVKA